MPKVTLDVESFKALASETRLDILKTLDGKNMNLTEITKKTNLSKMTLHEHLNKLHTAGFVKRIERSGHKWVYYKLTFKGYSLLHPESSRIVVLFSMTFVSLVFGIVSLVSFLGSKKDFIQDSPGVLTAPSKSVGSSSEPVFLYLTVIFMLVFLLLITISFWRYDKNREQKL